MTQVVPVNLAYNVKTLWFDPNGHDVHVDDDVVVSTARGLELGKVAADPFDVPYEDIKALKCPLKPVERIATPEDLERDIEMKRKAAEAMPVFRELALETCEDMHPVSVEYLLDGDKAIFYFESEERIDFRDLVKKLAAHFKIRVDMRQIGVRDEARIVGGIGHCGQIVCCKRLGGEFKPVSIRMAKEQDLSLNQQKISGLCGRLMCCLRYENEAYKDFKQRAPKVGASVTTPAGCAKVCSLDVPREIVEVKIEGENPVKVPLTAFEEAPEGKKPSVVTDDGWEAATTPADFVLEHTADIFSTSHFVGNEKLASGNAKRTGSGAADPLAQADAKKQKRSGSRKSSSKTERPERKKPTRRRSTKIVGSSSEGAPNGSKNKSEKDASNNSSQAKTGLRPGQKSSGLARPQEDSASPHANKKKHRRRRNLGNSSAEN